MKKYENYKTASTEWFGQVPSHWDTTSFKNLIQRNDGGVWGDDAEEGEGNIVLRSTEINLDGTWNLEAPAYRKLSADEIQKACLKAGDLLVTKSSGSELHIGKTALVDEKLEALVCCYSNFTQRIRLTDFNDSRFFFYFLNCPIARTQYNLLSKSAIGLANLSGTLLGNLVVPKVPLPEQRAIAAYLDHKTAQLDTLLAQKETLLQKLHQKRQALINEAVTQGLDRAAPRKPSGVAWLGDVPAHWEVKRLKQLTSKIGSGVTPLGGANVYEDHGIPLFRSQNIYPNGLRLDDVAFITEEVHQSMKNSQVETGDVLLNITGASIGRCYFYQGENKQANVNQHVCIIRPNEQIGTEFLHLALASNLGQHQIDISQNGASREGLTFTQLREFRIACPSISEQAEIVRTVNLRLSKINEATAAIHTQIKTLKAYRQSLISEVVTGKLDVRPAVLAPEADLPLWQQ